MKLCCIGSFHLEKLKNNNYINYEATENKKKKYSINCFFIFSWVNLFKMRISHL